MSQDLVAQADRCFVEEEFEDAIKYYTQALGPDPNNARIYESRSHAYIKTEQYLEANEDAAKAIELDPKAPKAYLRRGIALFNLEEFEAAKEAFEAGQKHSADGAFKTWIRKCQAELEDEQECSQAKVAKPTQASASKSQPPAAPTLAPAPEPVIPSAPAPTESHASAPLAPAAAPVQEGKYRHQHYQLQGKVTVDIYAKKLKKEQVSCKFDETHLLVTINDASGQEEYTLDVELYGKIVPESCKFEVLSTKVEVTMLKADNIQWGSLEKSSKVAAPNYSTPGTDVPRQYPTSTKAPKDWEKVDSELSELEKKGELDSGDPLNNFFKKIFSQGDEHTQRAMMKSFVESNGTVLSTNWDEVGKKKVECTPPDGMEVHKWTEK